MRSVLVHVDGTARCAARLQFASELAQRQEAQLTALFAVTPPLLDLPYAYAASAIPLETLQQAHAKWRTSARVAFDAAKASRTGAMAWAELDAESPVAGFVRQAFFADLLVLGQNDPADTLDSQLPGDFVESVLIESGKPVLIVPYAGRFPALPETALVAWKTSPQSARALAASLPLLRRARQVHVASWGEPPVRCFGDALDVERYLQLHGVTATMQARPVRPHDRRAGRPAAQEARGRPGGSPDHQVGARRGLHPRAAGRAGMNPFDDGSIFRTLFAAYPDALLVVDASGSITLANPAAAELLGYTVDELSGLGVDELVADSIRPRHAAYRAAYAHAPRARPMGTQMELVAKRRDGSEVMVEIALSPLQEHGLPYTVAAVRATRATRCPKAAASRSTAARCTRCRRHCRPSWARGPTWRSRSRTAAAEDEADVGGSVPRGLRVLMVEDDTEVRAVVSRFLEAMGCEVTTSVNAEQALPTLAPGAPFDLLLTDIALGAGMRGTELARHAQERLPQLPVLLMTGFSSGLIETPPGWELLRKPYTRADLARAIAKVLAVRGA